MQRRAQQQPWRRLAPLVSALLLLPLTSAWSSTMTSIKPSTIHHPSISNLSIQRQQSCSTCLFMSSPPDTVDEVYYSPVLTDRLPESAQEMEMTAAAQKYGAGGSVPGAKITLTRWLSAKVQDFPEVSFCWLMFITHGHGHVL